TRVDYYDNSGDASVQLSWTTPGAAKAVVPTSALYPAAVDPSSTRSDITGLTLINADTDQPIGALKDGATLDLSTLPTKNLAVRADTSTSATVGSIKFGLDSNSNFRVENNAPYAMAGNSGSDYFAWTPANGTHTI